MFTDDKIESSLQHPALELMLMVSPGYPCKKSVKETFSKLFKQGLKNKGLIYKTISMFMPTPDSSVYFLLLTFHQAVDINIHRKQPD